MGTWIGGVAVCVTVLVTGAARADTRYYLLQARFEWRVTMTEDSVGFTLAAGAPASSPSLAAVALDDPLDMTVLLKVDDLNSQERVVRVTYYLQSLTYEAGEHNWSFTDFTDHDAIDEQARGFLASAPAQPGVAGVMSYEQEAIARLLSTVHGKSVAIDLDVTPDMPDVLIYQADALILDVMAKDASQRVPRKNDVPYVESEAQASQLEQAVRAGGAKRAERLRHLLWGQLKLMATFVESHGYEFFRPRDLSADAPLLLEPQLGNTIARNDPAFWSKHAAFTGSMPAYGYPSFYRWGSISEQDFARMLSQATWRRTDNTPPAGGNVANRDAARAEDRMEATRQTLSDPPVDYNRMDEIRGELSSRESLGARYIETLVRLHKANRAGAAAPSLGAAWTARVMFDKPDSIVAGDQAVQPLEDRTIGPLVPGPFGLWVATLDGAHFDVNKTLKRVDNNLVAQRSMTVQTVVKEALLFAPGLGGDGSPSRLCVVDLAALTKLEAKRLSDKEAEGYLPAKPAAE